MLEDRTLKSCQFGVIGLFDIETEWIFQLQVLLNAPKSHRNRLSIL